jgi:hypothetical protein
MAAAALVAQRLAARAVVGVAARAVAVLVAQRVAARAVAVLVAQRVAARAVAVLVRIDAPPRGAIQPSTSRRCPTTSIPACSIATCVPSCAR